MRYLPLLLLFVFAGCGSSGPVMVACEGTLLLNGKPLEVAKREIGVGQVSLEFIPVENTPNAQPYGAQVDAAGKFSLPGGVTPGKYKVVVRQWDPYPQVDKLQGKFDKEHTPLVRQIDGKSPINIELSKPE
ncbi:carboxypeptidase-like regulatory domain-containing protein [Anatilimnocola floriformis]|uniref:carboxypeptidase-like regulatory domain-containing protein n=1 Tax=Anatilimnocola floriformis TaxID=2948575 RepID=UPI0020C401EE|nr:carboxypeptidase-like regulatory domain-containing protein [Anatilimnocola floriformis]